MLNKLSNRQLILRVIIVFVLLGLSFLAGYLIKDLWHKNQPQLSNTEYKYIEKCSQAEKECHLSLNSLAVLPSLDKSFTLYLLPVYGGKPLCKFGLFNSDGENYTYLLEDLINEDAFGECEWGEGGFFSGFVSWLEGDRFLINKDDLLTLVDLTNKATSTFKYNSEEFTFEVVDEKGENWVFRKKYPSGTESPKETVFMILDEKQNIILNNIVLPNRVRSVLYDSVNNGFLFITRNYFNEKQEMANFRLDFMPVATKKMKKLMETQPIEVFGHGCAPETLESKPGEIILYASCLPVEKKLLDEQGFLHIKL